MTFVTENKDRVEGGLRWGVEPICAALSMCGARLAPSSYYEAVSRRPSARDLRDEQLRPHIEQVHADSAGTFGPRRVWKQLNSQGITVARCTVERLMADLGLVGNRRGATRAAAAPRRHADVDHPLCG